MELNQKIDFKYLLDQIFSCELSNDNKCDYQFYPSFTAWDENSETADYSYRHEGMPFFAVYNYDVTHESKTWFNADYPMLVDTRIIPIPGYYPYISVVKKDVGRKYSNIRNFYPGLPLIYRNEYCEQIDMTIKLIEMYKNGELEGGASYILRNSRYVEELYNLEKDPDEIQNLAGRQEYIEQFFKMMKQLVDWQLKVNYKGLIDEYNLVQIFCPGLIPPATEKVVVDEEKDIESFFVLPKVPQSDIRLMIRLDQDDGCFMINR